MPKRKCYKAAQKRAQKFKANLISHRKRMSYKVSREVQKCKAASALSKFKKKIGANDPKETIDVPSEVDKAWQKAIESMNNLPTDIIFPNLISEFIEDVGNEKEMSISLENLFEKSDELGSILKQKHDSAECKDMQIYGSGIEHTPTGQDMFCRKNGIRLNNHHKSKTFLNKHTYFDNDGNKIVDSIQTHSGSTALLHSPTMDNEISSVISTHFKGKTSIVNHTKWIDRRRMPSEIANDQQLRKYWDKRISLFSLYDLGVELDKESWFSVTPEKIASHIAQRCKCDVIIDGFCGAAGNAIQFAMTCAKVIAIDVDPRKIEMAKHNAAIYGVSNRIEFIVGDFFTLIDSFKADAIILSPPWGGPKYSKKSKYLFDVETELTPVSLSELLRVSRKISQNIAIYLPRNSNTRQLAKLAGPERPVEIEQCSLDGRLIAITAYYGTLFNK